MKQYRVTYNAQTGEGDDCLLDPNDPLHKIREGMFLGSIPGVNTYPVYPEDDGTDGPKNPYSRS